VETRTPGGPNWQMGLRTPGTAITPHRYGAVTADSLLSSSSPRNLPLLLAYTGMSR
jgi:hypothetical protein